MAHTGLNDANPRTMLVFGDAPGVFDTATNVEEGRDNVDRRIVYSYPLGKITVEKSFYTLLILKLGTLRQPTFGLSWRALFDLDLRGGNPVDARVVDWRSQLNFVESPGTESIITNAETNGPVGKGLYEVVR